MGMADRVLWGNTADSFSVERTVKESTGHIYVEVSLGWLLNKRINIDDFRSLVGEASQRTEVFYRDTLAPLICISDSEYK
jgi:hypothetical protein